jgi:hypothetical protein
MTRYHALLASSLLNETTIARTINFWKRGIVMTEVIEFEATTHWRPSFLPTKENESYSEERDAGVKSIIGQEAWASCRLNRPGIRPVADEIMEPRQISLDETLLAGVDMWGSVYALLETPTNRSHAISVETPLDHWFWCADPAISPRICLKKRMSILTAFAGLDL